MQLKELLGESLYSQVIRKAGEQKIDIVSDGRWIPKGKFNRVNNEKNNFKKQLQETQAQLEYLLNSINNKEKSLEELEYQINKLQDVNKIITELYEVQVKQNNLILQLI